MTLERFEGVIIISGLPAAGKGSLSETLATRLGWDCISIGNLWREKHEIYLKQNPNVQISFPNWWKGRSIEEQRAMDNRVREMIKNGNIVGDFRYAKLAEGLPNVRPYFLTAPLPVRAKRAMQTNKYKNMLLLHVAYKLQGRETDEVHIGRQIYGQNYDYRNKEHYLQIIDNTNMEVEDEVRTILGDIGI